MDSNTTLSKPIWRRKPELLLTLCSCRCSFPTSSNPSQQPRLQSSPNPSPSQQPRLQSSPNPNPSQQPRPSENHLTSYFHHHSLKSGCFQQGEIEGATCLFLHDYPYIVIQLFCIICPISWLFLIPPKSQQPLKKGSLTQLSPRLTN